VSVAREKGAKRGGEVARVAVVEAKLPVGGAPRRESAAPRRKAPVRATTVARKAGREAIVVVGGGPPMVYGDKSPALVDPARARDFGRRLRAWFRRHGRDLPWRRTRDPYRILVSELMLQQTQVARVLDYWPRFLERFPTLADVARARPARVREAWAGLGYYARARNLHRLAREVTDRGRAPHRTLPATPAELRALPGIGAYTAGAVASFAFERRAALVDTNVARVLQRVFAPHVDPKTTAGSRHVWTVAEHLLPRDGRTAWTHNQALMELGALVCTARVRRCGQCPVRGGCATYERAPV
jgi:A/G-specific adenine glycosylase